MTELTDEERADIAAAKHTIMFEGRLVVVTRMMDNEGDFVQNPMKAFRCVAYDPDSPAKDKWVAMLCTPGEIAPRRAFLGEVK